jgi:biotin carboxyl carrier protein
MYKITINGKLIGSVATDIKKDKVILNGQNLSAEFKKESSDVIQLNIDGKIYEGLVLSFNREEKKVILKINQNKYLVELKDKFDELLDKLGFDVNASKKQNQIKAPMPGLVVQILANEGAQIKKGEPLVILEAMKMENILKSPCDAVVKKILVNKGSSVEKNQLLVEFS